MAERGKIYWHEAHFVALQLEFHQYENLLEFEQEHRLSEEALRMDVLVIKKNRDVPIEKNIGKIFRKHNIFEYKSESDGFSLWDYNKVLGYALLYSSFEKVPLSDITITISLTIFPKELVRFLANERGYTVKDLGDGIYHIDGDVVPVQILESKKLSPDNNLFLHNLRSDLSNEEMLKTLESYSMQRPLDDRNVFLDRLIRANLGAFKEASKMSEAVKAIFLKTAEENGWLENHDTENAKKFAKKLLQLGDSIEKVAEATELPIDTVMSLV